MQAGVLDGNKDNADVLSRFRRVRSHWRNSSLTGVLLTARSLNAALSSAASYQRTIRGVGQADYLRHGCGTRTSCRAPNETSGSRTSRRPRWS